MKVEDLYINPRNIVTLIPFVSIDDGICGLQINGTNVVFSRFKPSDKEEAESCLQNVKKLQADIIEKIEGSDK